MREEGSRKKPNLPAKVDSNLHQVTRAVAAGTSITMKKITQQQGRVCTAASSRDRCGSRDLETSLGWLLRGNPHLPLVHFFSIQIFPSRASFPFESCSPLVGLASPASSRGLGPIVFCCHLSMFAHPLMIPFVPPPAVP